MMTLKYDYTFMIDEINKFISLRSIANIVDKEEDHKIVNDMIVNYIENMEKLRKETPNYFSEIDRKQQLHLMDCSFKIALMDKFNELLTEVIECFGN